MKPDRPPRGATRLLAALLPARGRDALLGDLQEDWTRRRASGRPARLWYWRQAAALAAGYHLHRRRTRPRPRPIGLAADLGAAARHAWRDRRFSAVVVLLLGAGLGVTTIWFGVLHALVVRPLPYPEAERLVALHETHVASGVLAGPASPGNFLDWHEHAASFESLAASYTSEVALTGLDPVESILLGEVTPEFFTALGIPPLIGRGFSPVEEAGAWLDNAGRFHGPARVVLHESLWRARFDADSGLVGRTIGINGQPAEVIGVMPAAVRLPSPDVGAWVVWDVAAGYGAGGQEPPRNSRFVDVVARLAPGVAPEAARDELAALASRAATDHPRTNGGWSATSRPLADAVTDGGQHALGPLAAAVSLLLLGVATSLTALQTARLEGRRTELSVRAALGAGRARLLRQLMLENLVLAAAAALAGLVAAHLAAPRVFALLLPDLPGAETAPPQPWIVAAVLAVATATGAASVGVAALRSRGGGTSDPLRARATTGRGADRPLVVIEVGLAVALVVLTGLLAQSYLRLVSQDPGFEAEGVLTARLNLEAGVSAGAASRVAFVEQLLQELRREPAVEAAGGATFLPMTRVGAYFDRPYWKAGQTDPGGDAPRGWVRIVTPGLIEALGIELHAGRSFTADDRFDFSAAERDGAPRVAIVNRTLAENTWPGIDPVGRVLVMDYPQRVYEYRVVGVVEDVLPERLDSAPPPEIYLPYFQIPYPGLTLALRTRGDPARLAPRLRELVVAANALQPVDRIVPLSDALAASVRNERLVLGWAGAAGAVALLLAVIGVYGVVDLVVRRRTRELGIRLALGARPAQLRAMVLRSALGLALSGLALGTLLALAGSRLVAASLYRTAVLEPLPLAVATVTILAASLLAAWGPARRATRITPDRALRE